MRGFGRVVVLGVASVALGVAAEDRSLELARAALRDGLWDVARRHAEGGTDDTSRLVVLESLAREGLWTGVLERLSGWGEPGGIGFAFYRDVAKVRTGAQDDLASERFAGTPYAAPAARLRAERALARGQPDAALAALEGQDDAESRMVQASVRLAKGERDAARQLWRDVVSDTNAPPMAFAVAAANLEDVEALRRAFDGARSASVRHLAALRLGVLLLRKGETFGEGEQLVRRTVCDSPDHPEARPAYLSLAEAQLDRRDFAAASATFAEALEMWPTVAQEASVQEGRGWAFEGEGRPDEAMAAFAEAERVGTNAAARAMAAVKIGDLLSHTGRHVEAMQRYREAMQRYPGTPAVARIAESVKTGEIEEAGRRLFAEYRFLEAMEKFEAVGRRDGDRKARMAYYGVICLYGLGRDGEAERRARQLVSEASDPAVRADAALWLAKFSYNLAQWREAERLFTEAAAMRPGTPQAVEAGLWAARAAYSAGDSVRAVQLASQIVDGHMDTRAGLEAMLLQGEALVELARFDEAVLVLERVAGARLADARERLRARTLRADALFAMGADNPTRYSEALEAYRTLRLGAALSKSDRLVISYKIGKTLEKMKRLDEAVDQYYTQVLLAYREARAAGAWMDDEAKAVFSRAGFRLAEEYGSRGQTYQAVRMLDLVAGSDVPASEEAHRRLARLQGRTREK